MAYGLFGKWFKMGLWRNTTYFMWLALYWSNNVLVVSIILEQYCPCLWWKFGVLLLFGRANPIHQCHLTLLFLHFYYDIKCGTTILFYFCGTHTGQKPLIFFSFSFFLLDESLLSISIFAHAYILCTIRFHHFNS